METTIEAAFEKLSKSAAQDLVRNSTVLGLGSGSAVSTFAKALGDRVRKESLKVKIVPSSMQSWLLAAMNGLSLIEDTSHCPSRVDLAVDGADQITLQTRSMIKGGGGALLREKIIMSSAKECFILADESKFAPNLTRPVPVEVIQFATIEAEDKLKALGSDTTMRKLDKGYPFFTESGNVIIDCNFREGVRNPLELEQKIKNIPGVVEAGIFNFMVKRFYKANHDGTFDVL